MKFKKIEITGFKSFFDKTNFYIEDGLTGIVGPNGCGKSNIVEAIRFGLGEVSAKQLRGKEIDDLILNLDIPSLFLDYAGIKSPKSFQGKSFKKALESKNNLPIREFTYYRYW